MSMFTHLKKIIAGGLALATFIPSLVFAQATVALPPQPGNSGKFLQTDGLNLSWQAAAGSGGVTEGAPITGCGPNEVIYDFAGNVGCDPLFIRNVTTGEFAAQGAYGGGPFDLSAFYIGTYGGSIDGAFMNYQDNGGADGNAIFFTGDTTISLGFPVAAGSIVDDAAGGNTSALLIVPTFSNLNSGDLAGNAGDIVIGALESFMENVGISGDSSKVYTSPTISRISNTTADGTVKVEVSDDVVFIQDDNLGQRAGIFYTGWDAVSAFATPVYGLSVDLYDNQFGNGTEGYILGNTDKNYLKINGHNGVAGTTEIFGGISVYTAVIFTGVGLDDMAQVSGAFYGSSTVVWTITIDSTGTPNTFTWVDSVGNTQSNVPITGASITLSYGAAVQFGADTGHTIGDSWTFDATQTQTRAFYDSGIDVSIGDTNSSATGTKILVGIESGLVNISNVPDYADDATATGAGLVTGDLYQTTTGGSTFLKIVP